MSKDDESGDEKKKKKTIRELIKGPRTPEEDKQLEELNAAAKKIFSDSPILKATESLRKQHESLGRMFPGSLADMIRATQKIPKIDIPKIPLPEIPKIPTPDIPKIPAPEIYSPNIEPTVPILEISHPQHVTNDLIQDLIKQQSSTQRGISELLDYTRERDVKAAKSNRFSLWLEVAILIIAFATLAVTIIYGQNPPVVNVNPEVNLQPLVRPIESLNSNIEKNSKLLENIESNNASKSGKNGNRRK